jgi:predicted small secreted protein
MKPLIILLLASGCLFVYGCNGGSGAPMDIQAPSPDVHEATGSSSTDTVEITGTVTFVNLEGGFFTIQGNDGSTYTPINLPESFRKDGLEINALVRPRPDVMSIHMVGPIIEIVDILAD